MISRAGQKYKCAQYSFCIAAIHPGCFHDNGVTTNSNHHKTTDTHDTLDYEYLLTSVTKLALSTILSLDKLT
jgi:hypothetical protein